MFCYKQAMAIFCVDCTYKLYSLCVCVCVCVIYHILTFIIINLKKKKIIKNKQQSYQFDKGNISYNIAIRSNSLIIHFNVMYSKNLVTKWHSWSFLWGELGFESSSPTCCNNWIIYIFKMLMDIKLII